MKCHLHSAKASIYSMQNCYSEELCELRKHLNSVMQAASGYHKVLEDNRKLYNEIQELKGLKQPNFMQIKNNKFLMDFFLCDQIAILSSNSTLSFLSSLVIEAAENETKMTVVESWTYQ